MRTLPAYKKTPVVFVTSLNNFESRANSTMSGGNDFIAKPFLFIELAVKALVYVLAGPAGTSAALSVLRKQSSGCLAPPAFRCKSHRRF